MDGVGYGMKRDRWTSMLLKLELGAMAGGRLPWHLFVGDRSRSHECASSKFPGHQLRSSRYGEHGRADRRPAERRHGTARRSRETSSSDHARDRLGSLIGFPLACASDGHNVPDMISPETLTGHSYDQLCHQRDGENVRPAHLHGYIVFPAIRLETSRSLMQRKPSWTCDSWPHQPCQACFASVCQYSGHERHARQSWPPRSQSARSP